MLKKEIEKAFNEQINAELYSSYLYLSMAAYFESNNLAGFGNWMRVQAQEELVHAMKFFTFIHERGGKVVLDAIAKPPAKWSSPKNAFQEVYKHECKVSALIHKLVDLAIAEKDHAANAFLQWFVEEQIEEEASADAIVKKLELLDGAPGGMYMLDRELGQRTFAMPPSAEGA
ncbi:MAG TPA: ferritin [Candidatus Hydrogenedentes bacterium]|nr:ferritin [Candidatus Hydrogenedentota bacterium]